MRNDPTFAYLLTGQKGYLGSIRGDVMLLSKCTNVSHAVKVRSTADCFEGDFTFQ